MALSFNKSMTPLTSLPHFPTLIKLHSSVSCVIRVFLTVFYLKQTEISEYRWWFVCNVGGGGGCAFAAARSLCESMLRSSAAARLTSIHDAVAYCVRRFQVIFRLLDTVGKPGSDTSQSRKKLNNSKSHKNMLICLVNEFSHVTWKQQQQWTFALLLPASCRLETNYTCSYLLLFYQGIILFFLFLLFIQCTLLTVNTRSMCLSLFPAVIRPAVVFFLQVDVMQL